MRALFAGSFDPVTHGHIDLIARLAAIAETVVVAVAVNPEKHPLFSGEERLAMMRDACRDWANVEVRGFGGLIVDAACTVGADVLVRGIRTHEEFAGECRMAQMNRALSGIETLLLPASPHLAYITSSLVKEIARLGGDVSSFVPPDVLAHLQARMDAVR